MPTKLIRDQIMSQHGSKMKVQVLTVMLTVHEGIELEVDAFHESLCDIC